jgi:hypothetical protein
MCKLIHLTPSQTATQTWVNCDQIWHSLLSPGTVGVSVSAPPLYLWFICPHLFCVSLSLLYSLLLGWVFINILFCFLTCFLAIFFYHCDKIPEKINLKRGKVARVLVAHVCNPSYSGGRDQEDRGSKPAQSKQFLRSYFKKPFTKKGWWNGSRGRPWVQTPALQKKKRKRKEEKFILAQFQVSVPISWKSQHLPRVSQAGDNAFNTQPCGGHLSKP